MEGRLWLKIILSLALSCMTSAGLRAQEAYLVTYGPGQEIWELFGHNAIWIRDPGQSIDHSFSFGYFDLDRPGFHRDFARGIMPYYGSTGRIEREFDFYRQRDRDIRVQQLNLSSDEVARLFNLLHQSIFPQPQYYDYDYYLANCSTRLRDVLDELTGGALSDQLKERPAEKNFRDHTRAMTAHRLFLYTGIQTLLGPMVDQSNTVWDETFLPQRLAESLNEVELERGRLVLSDRMEYQSASVSSRFDAPGLWPWHLTLGIVCLTLLILPGVLESSGRGGRISPIARWIISWIGAVSVGLAGLVIALMWVASGHEATWRNAMLLVLNPLWMVWILPLRDRWRAPLWSLLLVCAVLGIFYLAVPLGQFRPDILLWYAPLVGGLLWLGYGSWSAGESKAKSRSI
mgnify:CR=1 FL=1